MWFVVGECRTETNAKKSKKFIVIIFHGFLNEPRMMKMLKWNEAVKKTQTIDEILRH